MVSRALGFVVLLGVLASGCASVATDTGAGTSATPVVDESGSEPPATTSDEMAAPETTLLEPAETTKEPAPADPVALIGGGQFDLGSIEGTDAVLWFWAPW